MPAVRGGCLVARCLPLLEPDPNLLVRDRKFLGAPRSAGDLVEVGVEEVGMGGRDLGKDVCDVVRFQPQLGIMLLRQLRVLEDHDPDAIFCQDTIGLGCLQVLVFDGELQAIGKEVQAVCDVDVEYAGDEF